MDINLYKDSYASHVREALGRNKNPDLSLCCFREQTPDSDTFNIPSWVMQERSDDNPSSKAVRKPTREVYSRDDFEKSEKTMADFIKMMGTHQTIKEYYTVSNAQNIKGGHQFKKEKELIMGNDPTSRTVTAIGQMVFDDRQDLFIEGLTAEKVQRKIGKTTQDVVFPATQTLTAKKAGEFSVKSDLPRVKALFRKANVSDKINIFGLINTDDCAMFEELNFDTIYNTRYVQGDDLRNGTIPSIFGVKWIPTNLIPAGTMWFWLYDAISWVPYSPLEHEMGKSPLTDFDVHFKISEDADCKRTDDRGVCKFVIAG